MKRILLSLILILATVGSATADSAQERARGLNRKAMTQYDLGRFDDAIRLFQEAYEVFPEPKILFNLAQAFRKKQAYKEALESYRSYLRNAPGAPNRAVVEERIKELEQLIASQQASDAKPPDGVTSVPPPVVGPQKPAPSLTTTPIDTGRRWYQDPVGWTLAGSGAVAAAAGVAFLVHASSQQDDLATTSEADRDGLRDDIHRNQLLGGVALGVGGALVVAGAVKFVLTERSRSRSGTHLAVVPGGLLVYGSF
jgi:tetratricopeptide (TPR) repeat protein